MNRDRWCRRGIWTSPQEGERGSVSAFLALSAVPMVVLAGLAVDLGGQVSVRQHATDIAAQAARTGGQQLQEARAVHGDGVRIDPGRAVAAARTYLAAADVTGTVTVRGGATVVVTTTASYDTKFLGIIGITRLTVQATAEARTVRAVHGTPR